MIISDSIKQSIIKEYSDWESIQYGKYKDDKEWHQAMGAFYTPPEHTITLLEQVESLDDIILDPTCGCGGLLAGAILAGADPKLCYGIELDPEILKICRERLGKLGVPYYNIHLGNALNDECYDHFDDTYSFNPDVGENGQVSINGKPITTHKSNFEFGK